MALVSLNCPNCGGSLQMEDTLEKGFCMYCSSSFMVQEEIQRIQVEQSALVNISHKRKEEADNIAALGRMKFEEYENIDTTGCNWILDEYVEKALRYDCKNEQALALKSDVMSIVRKIDEEIQKQQQQERFEEEQYRKGIFIIKIILGILGLIYIASWAINWYAHRIVY